MPRPRSRWDTSRARKFRALASIPDSVRKTLRPVIEKNAKRINALQKQLVPVDTGALRLNISYTMGQSPVLSSSASFSSTGRRTGDPDLSAFIYAGTENKSEAGWYARFVEFGTAPHGGHPGTDPQPFFYPAIRILKKDVTRSVQRAFNKGLKDAGIRSNKPRGRTVKKG